MGSDFPQMPAAGLLGEVEAVIAEMARTRGPAVVGIDRRAGRGTGIVVAPGEVLTLASNLRDPAGEVAVIFPTSAGAASATAAGTTAGGSVPGTVAGIDDALDLALIRVPTAAVEPLDWAPGPPGLGQAVIALANPGGAGLRVTLGFVGALDRSFRGPRGRVVDGALEHTAPLPRGSAGGPLLDVGGRVVGLNAARAAGGLILALPGSAVSAGAGRLGDGPAEPRRLGVAVVSPQVARRLRRAVGLPDRDGVLVQAVAAGSPADRAGVRAGDLVVSAAGNPVDDVDALYAALDRVLPGGTIDLRVVRGVEEHEIAVPVGGSG